MIYSLCGDIAHKSVDEAVIVCGGVGYRVHMPAAAAAALTPGKEATIYTYLNVKEDGLDLFGFSDTEQQKVFTMLISVSGVGPRIGLAILNALSANSIILAIAAADYKAFTAAGGVGPKLAQRIVLELKSKAGAFDMGADITGMTQISEGNTSKALSALVALGYSQSEGAVALSGCDPNASIEDLIKTALKRVASH